jgi:alkylation response protein AidB-like acyl-CoA dehydrogenase
MTASLETQRDGPAVESAAAAALVVDWLRSSLPPEWIACIDAGISPGPLTSYAGFDLDEWVGDIFSRRILTAAWPSEFGGLGWNAAVTRAAHEELAHYAAPIPLYVPAILMVGSAILRSGSSDQMVRFLPKMASGEELWTQLFSEPEAGSDLASLRARATRRDGGWIVNGQKVWSSFAHRATWGLLLARTDLDVPRHAGITAFIVDMKASGVDVRPLRQLTGESTFNEVFLDEVVVPDWFRLGSEGGGWPVATWALQSERSILSVQRIGGTDVMRLIARHRGTVGPIERQRLADAYIRHRIAQFFAWRGYGNGPESPVTKVHLTESNRSLQELAVDLEGPHGQALQPQNDELAYAQYGFLRSRANTIAGGTSEVMRNVIAERLLGLPRDRSHSLEGRR